MTHASPLSVRWQPQGLAIVPTEPWEQDGLRNFTCPAEPLGDGGGNGGWRLWYYARTADRRSCEIGIAEGIPGSPSARKYRLRRAPGNARLLYPGERYTLSNLPDGWLPVQPVHLVLPGGGHRLYFWAHAPGIVRYLCADSCDGFHYTVADPYRAILYHYHDRAVEKNTLAADGLTFWGNTAHTRPGHEPAANPMLVTNDATNLYAIPGVTPDAASDAARYELYTACIVSVPKDSPRYIAEDNAAGFVRVIDRFTSRDGLHFEDRRRVLEPDTDEPPGLQFYGLAVTHLPDGRRYGQIGHYRCDTQILSIERAMSDDGGLTWQRPDRFPCMDAGFNGGHDIHGLLPSHNVVYHDNAWWCFYTGHRHTHNFKKSAGLPTATVLLAKSGQPDTA
ncbi:MAG: hypothetical protein LBK99_17920 [Opitutaceae bacterium]|jgi:hypothetical protein|nr:hypothetical protein [Opitutaceae bacterium]